MFKKIWRFIWYDDSLLSWIVSVLLAFIIVKFIIFPGLGFLLNTQLPVVAVVSGSMEHDGNFDNFWERQGSWYEENSITKEEFKNYPMKNGFNKGDIIFLYGSKNLKTGDIIVFKGNSQNPIIHRLVKIHDSYQTKGDNNQDSFKELNETNINPGNVIGKAFLRIPYLGWVKIGFTNLISYLPGGLS